MKKLVRQKDSVRIKDKSNPMYGVFGVDNPLFGRKRPEHSKLMQGENNPNYKGGKLSLVCENCGKKFKRWPSIRGRRDFCCRKCYDFAKRMKLDENNIYDLYYNKHKSQDKIAVILGCTRANIKEIFDRNNWNPRTRSEAFLYNDKKIKIPVSEIVELYKSNTIESIAKKFKCSSPVIVGILKENNIIVRSFGESIVLLNSISGSKNPNWRGGTNKLPYSFDWTVELKAVIRKRDGYKCVCCDMEEKEHNILYKRNLTVHHIDYNKQNCVETNLATTCVKCNARANGNRDYWYAFYTYLINK